MKEEKDLNTSTIGLDDLKMIAVEIKDIEKFFESLEDIENNYLEINDVFNPFDVFKEINFESNEIDFPELEDIQIIKELTLSESLEKSSSISSLLNNKIISLGEEPKEKIYTLNCQSLEQIIDDLKDFKESVNELEEELVKSSLFKTHFLGKDGFIWWIGQIVERKAWVSNVPGAPTRTTKEKKGFDFRYKVRIMGYHT